MKRKFAFGIFLTSIALTQGCKIRRTDGSDPTSVTRENTQIMNLQTYNKGPVDATKLHVEKLSIKDEIESIKESNGVKVHQLGIHLSLNADVDYYTFSICKKDTATECNPTPQDPRRFSLDSHIFPNPPTGEIEVIVTPCVEAINAADSKVLCGKAETISYVQPKGSDPSLLTVLTDRYNLETLIKTKTLAIASTAEQCHSNLQGKVSADLSNFFGNTSKTGNLLAETFSSDIFNELVQEVRDQQAKQSGLGLADNMGSQKNSNSQNAIISAAVLAGVAGLVVTGGTLVYIQKLNSGKSEFKKTKKRILESANDFQRKVNDAKKEIKGMIINSFNDSTKKNALKHLFENELETIRSLSRDLGDYQKRLDIEPNTPGYQDNAKQQELARNNKYNDITSIDARFQALSASNNPTVLQALFENYQKIDTITLRANETNTFNQKKIAERTIEDRLKNMNPGTELGNSKTKVTEILNKLALEAKKHAELIGGNELDSFEERTKKQIEDLNNQMKPAKTKATRAKVGGFLSGAALLVISPILGVLSTQTHALGLAEASDSSTSTPLILSTDPNTAASTCIQRITDLFTNIQNLQQQKNPL